MLIGEKFPLGSGLFEKINNHIPFNWNDIFTPAQMELYFYTSQSNGRLSPDFENVEIDTIANLIGEMFVKKWNDIYNINYANVTNQLGFTSTETETYTGENAFTENETENNVNKVSSFDSDTLQDNEQDNNTNSKSHSGTTENTKTKTKQGHNDNYLLNSERLYNIFTNRFIYDIVFNDIKSILLFPLWK